MPEEICPIFLNDICPVQAKHENLHHQIKKHLAVTTCVTKAFDKTLEAIDDLDQALTQARTQKLTADSRKVQDLDRIISILEKAQDVIIEAVVIFQKHERVL